MDAPVIEVAGRFDDAPRAAAAVEALNRWFRWIVEGSKAPMPDFFGPFGVDSTLYAVALGDDVDWELGPHARAVPSGKGAEVRVAMHTADTHVLVAGLLRRLGAQAVRVARDDG